MSLWVRLAEISHAAGRILIFFFLFLSGYNQCILVQECIGHCLQRRGRTVRAECRRVGLEHREGYRRRGSGAAVSGSASSRSFGDFCSFGAARGYSSRVRLFLLDVLSRPARCGPIGVPEEMLGGMVTPEAPRSVKMVSEAGQEREGSTPKGRTPDEMDSLRAL